MLSYADPPAPPALVRPAVRRAVWAWAKLLAGVAILAVLAWRVGTGGFLAAFRVIDAGTLLAACAIGLLTTVLSAWRWCLVARGLGIKLPLATATADYYRAQFLNVALPGGILGDVHRAVRHGRDAGNLGLGVRAVALERFAGQLVVVAIALAVLVALPGPSLTEFLGVPPAVLLAGLVGVVAVVVLVTGRLRRASVRWARTVRTTLVAVRDGVLDRRIWPGIVLSSAAVLAGSLAMFLLAARAAGATAPVSQLLPLLVLSLLAMMLPVSVGGWGPREGACAWAFGAAGLGASQGLTVAVVYGLSIFVASLPGAAVLLVRFLKSR
ncbi:MAG TPA: lysylphosphatidylglycerol synthase transmembrane domain-containing protein [Natronosporangium sp.]